MNPESHSRNTQIDIHGLRLAGINRPLGQRIMTLKLGISLVSYALCQGLGFCGAFPLTFKHFRSKKLN